jgi:hypothetical protein
MIAKKYWLHVIAKEIIIIMCVCKTQLILTDCKSCRFLHVIATTVLHVIATN